MTEDTSSPAEIAFMRRLAFHGERGLSYEEALQAVITEGGPIFAALLERRRDTITRELSRTANRRIRARKP